MSSPSNFSEPTLVSDFVPGGDRVDQLLAYPYARPERSFVTDGVNVSEVPSDWAGFKQSVDSQLSARELPSIDERFAVVGYSSNVSPARLMDKMKRYAPGLQDLLQFVPNFKVTIPDAQVVWHGAPSQAGSVFAELHISKETVDKQTDAFVQFLTAEQLAHIDVTEGVTYQLTEVKAKTEDGTELKALAYLPKDSVMLRDESGMPLPVKLSSDGPGATAEEAVDFMLGTINATNLLGVYSARELVEMNLQPGTSLADKKSRQVQIQQELAAIGISAKLNSEAGERRGRADYNMHSNPHDQANVYVLAEQVLKPLRPDLGAVVRQAAAVKLTDPGLPESVAMGRARRQLDIMQGPTGVRARATAEIAKHAGVKVLKPSEIKRVEIGPNRYRIESVNG